MRFTKMHGIGNDFIVVNGFVEAEPQSFFTLARAMCDRHYGIGADGLVWLSPSAEANARMRVFNTDGTEAEMCGNGLRCAARSMLDQGIVDAPEMTIETLAGVLRATITDDGIECDMGVPRVAPAEIPVAMPENRFSLEIGGRTLSFFCASMGNPHAVTFDLYPDDKVFHWLGPLLEKHNVFPNGANIEFCRMTDDGIDVRVWERGDGPTLGCGTGACAVLTAAATMGLCGREARVNLPGGHLHIRWAKGGHMFMSGPAQAVFTGEYAG
ncbi:MAG: diaminopimelate epimerase [Clostridiales bacterium]|nr:diaminopimelate epimerase [Clostridiales bacterium]